MAVKTRKSKGATEVTWSYKTPENLDQVCKEQIDKSKKDNPLQGTINDLIGSITKQVIEHEAGKGKESFTSTQIKEVTSARATLQKLKFKSLALKSALTRKLINAGNKLEAMERPHNYYILKDMVDSANKATITKRRETSKGTTKLTPELKREITQEMQRLECFTITDSQDKKATLAFNRISSFSVEFSRSQLESIVKGQIKNGYLKKLGAKEGKAVIYGKKKK